MIPANFKLEILTPTQTVYSGLVSQVVFPGSAGEIGVLPGHGDLLGVLGTGMLSLQAKAGHLSFVVSSGFYEVCEGNLSVLCEVAEPARQVDAEAAEKRATELRKQLSSTSGYAPEYANVKQSLDLEEARIAAAR